MKPKLLFIIFFMIILGCSNNRSNNRNEDVRLAIIDSITQVEGNKAIGCIDFGISEQQFKKSLDKFLLSIREYNDDKTSYWTRIGYFYLDTNKVFTLFNKDSLVYVSFYDDFIIDKYFTGGYLNNVIESLVDVFTKKYFTPDKYHPVLDDEWLIMPYNDSNTNIATWNIGKKQIHIEYTKSSVENETYYENTYKDKITLWLFISDEIARNRMIDEHFKEMEKNRAIDDSLQQIRNKEKASKL